MSGVERRARQLLAAYPWRVRAEQGDEIVGTVLEALPPGARRLPVRDQLDLVRGGVRTRLQRRPPLASVVRYRLGGRLGPEWLAWIRDDVDDPHFRRSELLRSSGLALLVWATVTVVPGLTVLAGWPVPFLVLGANGDAARRQGNVRRRHGLPPMPAAPAPGAGWLRNVRPRMANTRLVPVLAALGAAATTSGAAALVVVGRRGGSDGPVTLLGGEVTLPIASVVGVGVGAGVTVLLLLVDVLTRPPGHRIPIPAVTPSPRRLASAGGGPAALLVVAAAVAPRGLVGAVEAAAAAAVPLGLLTAATAVVVVVGERLTGHRFGLWDMAPRLGLHPPTAVAPGRSEHPSG